MSGLCKKYQTLRNAKWIPLHKNVEKTEKIEKIEKYYCFFERVVVEYISIMNLGSQRMLWG